MNYSRIKLITFDITGTILQFKHPIGRLYCDIGSLFGVKSNEDIIIKNFKREWIYMNRKHPIFGYNDIGWRNWWTTIVVNCFKDFNVDEKKGKEIANYLIENFQTMKYWKISNGALELLNHLKKKQICLGVISNFDERIETILNEAKLQHYFNFVIYSYGVGIQKPDVNIFKLAMNKSQRENIAPGNCLHIGDNYELDFMAAKSAKWNALLINKNDIKNKDISKNEIVHSLSEIKNLLTIRL